MCDHTLLRQKRAKIMDNIKLSPYLNFSGNTQEALEFYKEIFGGSLEISTFDSIPGLQVPEGYAKKVMHGVLEAPELIIMASESMPGREIRVGDNVSLSLTGNDSEKLTGWFKALSHEGHVTMPLASQAWGDTFGMCIDKYGISWLVNIAKPA
jgi:PhnB protein